MNIHTLQVTVWLLVSGYPALTWLFLRYARRVTARRAARVAAEHQEAFMRGTEMLTTQVADLTIEVERAREVAEQERGKSTRYFNKISDFEAERTKWQESYYAQSIGHGNAQELMMATIEKLSRQLQSLGHRPKIPSVLHAVRSEYLSTHEMPARAATESKPKVLETATETTPAD